jgi:hypothetical protein
MLSEGIVTEEQLAKMKNNIKSELEKGYEASKTHKYK